MPSGAVVAHQTWAWINPQSSREFNGGYPSRIYMDGWIPRNWLGWADYPADKSCDLLGPINELYFRELARFERT